jgi:hypothetical protein
MLVALVPTSALALATWLIIRYLTKLAKGTKLDMPHLDFGDGNNSTQRYVHGTGSILEQGYKIYLKKGSPFAMYNFMEASRPMAMLPVKYLAEVRSASTSKLSFTTFLNKVLWPYTSSLLSIMSSHYMVLYLLADRASLRT